MGDVDLETPDIDVDETEDDFRKTIAVIVALIAFFAIVIAYLQTVESNQEDRAARDAQRASVDGLGVEVDSLATLRADFGIADEIGLVRQRQAINAGRVRFQADDDVHQARADRYDAVQQALQPLTPIDPSNIETANEASADALEAPDAAQLLEGVLANRANDHGGKADNYVAVLTVLAVGLFLLGLSLTVEGTRTQWVLAGPGIAIAVVCILVTGVIAKRPISEVSERATDLVAQGQRAANAQDFEGAIALFDQAIEDSPSYAQAFARRGNTEFQAGLLQSGQTLFPSITSDEAREAARADLDRALELGGTGDFEILGQAGFLAFVDGDFERAADLSQQAIDINDQRANIHFNLGVALVALGDEDGAHRAYADGLRVLDGLPDDTQTSQILGGARTDLSILRTLVDGDELEDLEGLIEETEGTLADYEAGIVCSQLEGGCGPDAPEDATIGDATFERQGALVFATVPIEGADEGDAVSASWYFRTDPDLPFEQAAFPTMDVVDVIGGAITSVGVAVSSPLCPVGAEYLVRLYSNDQFLGEVTGDVAPSPVADRFDEFTDSINGLEVCSPEDFEQQVVDDPDLGRITTFVGDDLSFQPVVVRGVVPPGTDPLEAAASFFEGIGLDEDELSDVFLHAQTLVSGTFVDVAGLQGVTELADGTPESIAVSIDSQGTVRAVFVDGTDDPTLLAEIIELVLFTDLPENDA